MEVSKRQTSCDLDTKKPLDDMKGMDSDNGEYNDFEDENDDNQQIHHLQNCWVLWYFKSERDKNWEENQKKVITISTVEEFWGVINHIQPASSLSPGCDYSLFKEGIQPMWEDKANLDGGRWLIVLEKSQRHSHLHRYWMEILMMLIGEAFDDDGDQICGAIVNIRSKGDRVSLWTSNWRNDDAIMRIGYKMQKMLNTKPSQLIYQRHSDQQSKNNSMFKGTYTI